MGRIRTIKPEFPHSETLGRVSRDARLLFVNLFTIADDSGRARASSRLLASLLYPFDDDATKLIDKWLDELADVGAIRLYQSGDTKYLDIPKWLEHQKIDRPSKSRLPEFLDKLAISREASRGLDEPSTTDLGPRTLDLGIQTASQSGAKAPLPEDLKTRLFGPALDWLTKTTQKPEKTCRTLIGRWLSKHGEGQTIDAMIAAARNAPLDPIPYIEKVIHNGKSKRTGVNDAIIDQWDALMQSIPGSMDAERATTAGHKPEAISLVSSRA